MGFWFVAIGYSFINDLIGTTGYQQAGINPAPTFDLSTDVAAGFIPTKPHSDLTTGVAAGFIPTKPHSDLTTGVAAGFIPARPLRYA
jgi:hypothetical protein